MGINNLNLTYERDLSGTIIASSKSDSTPWNRIERVVDLANQSVKYSTGTLKKNDESSLPESFESYKENGELHFKLNNTYDKNNFLKRTPIIRNFRRCNFKKYRW